MQNADYIIIGSGSAGSAIAYRLSEDGKHTVMVLEDGKHGEEEREVVEKSKIIVDGKEVAVERILKNGTNYVKVRDIAAALDLEVSNKGNIAVLNHKEK